MTFCLRELPTLEEGFSKAFVKPITEIEHTDIVQLVKYYYRLRNLYFGTSKLGLSEMSQGDRIGIYKEINDLDYFFKILKTDPYFIMQTFINPKNARK